jgi:hypothetical protein
MMVVRTANPEEFLMISHPSTSVPHRPSERQLLGYRWAFNVFAVLFLLTIIAGLVNYLGSWIKYRMG